MTEVLPLSAQKGGIACYSNMSLLGVICIAIHLEF